MIQIIIKCILIILLIKYIKKIITYLKIKYKPIRKVIYNKKFQIVFYLLFALPFGFYVTNLFCRIFKFYDDTFIFKVCIILYTTFISVVILSAITTKRDDNKYFNKFIIWLFVQSAFTVQPYYMLDKNTFNPGGLLVCLNLYSLFKDRNKYWKLPILLFFINLYIYIPIFIEYIKTFN